MSTSVDDVAIKNGGQVASVNFVTSASAAYICRLDDLRVQANVYARNEIVVKMPPHAIANVPNIAVTPFEPRAAQAVPWSATGLRFSLAPEQEIEYVLTFDGVEYDPIENI